MTAMHAASSGRSLEERKRARKGRRREQGAGQILGTSGQSPPISSWSTHGVRDAHCHMETMRLPPHTGRDGARSPHISDTGVMFLLGL